MQNSQLLDDDARRVVFFLGVDCFETMSLIQFIPRCRRFAVGHNCFFQAPLSYSACVKTLSVYTTWLEYLIAVNRRKLFPPILKTITLLPLSTLTASA